MGALGGLDETVAGGVVTVVTGGVGVGAGACVVPAAATGAGGFFLLPPPTSPTIAIAMTATSVVAIAAIPQFGDRFSAVRVIARPLASVSYIWLVIGPSSVFATVASYSANNTAGSRPTSPASVRMCPRA